MNTSTEVRSFSLTCLSFTCYHRNDRYLQ